MSERQLATVRRIAAVDPIPGADAIEVATVTGWKVVIKKGEFVPGDLAVYCEIDSFLPICPEYEFLRKSSLRRMGGLEGFRLKTIRLRGQVSQGLLIPAPQDASEGDDVTEQLGIIKYEPPIPASLAGRARGPWPPVPKTDEERIQNLPEMLASEHSFYVTEKLDGSSATYVLNRENFFVCSRNLNLVEDAENTFWRIARELNLEEKMRAHGGNFAVQGELIGPGVQGNRYKLAKNEVRLYSAFNVDTHEYLPWETLTSLAKELGMETVPLIRQGATVKNFGTIEEFLADADGPSAIGGAPREGLVWRAENTGAKIGFKAISNAFLLATDS
ncbi:MAG: RNA ligase (ATP) [Acidobacteria bacterium]|nr:RNA ligase (ATP) [Acidobacteriota bacterium]